MTTTLHKLVSFIFLPALLAALLSLPNHTASTSTQWYAVCNDQSHGNSGWYGPVKDYSGAYNDAQAHMKANPGHNASVLAAN